MPTGVYERTEFHRKRIREGAPTGRFKIGNTLNSLRKDRQTNYIKKSKYIRKGYPEHRKGHAVSPETKYKLRLAKISDIGKGFRPTIGKDEKHILDVIGTCLGYYIIRQYPVKGYFIDGYCPALNLAIEVDEYKHRFKTDKDIYRQSFLEKEIGCKFLRLSVPRY